jgi:hypothetical protein
MYDISDGEEDNTKRKTVCFWQFSGEVAVCSGTVATDQGVQILNFFFVGFVKEVEEILYMMMLFQKIVYGSQDLTDRV